MPKYNFPITLRGACQNNLKDIDLTIEPGRLTVITGLSGTGKSTLLFDVLHAEGQRRYIETFSPYVRQFLESLPRPKIKSMSNARPSIAVEQKNSVKNSRSTVGTMTELCDYFKVWFPLVARLHDPDDNGRILEVETPAKQALSCISRFQGQILVIGFWAQRGGLSKDEFLHFLISAGHARIMVDAKYVRIEEVESTPWDEVSAFVVVDRTVASTGGKIRLSEAISLSLRHGKGISEARSQSGELVESFHWGLRSRVSGRSFSTLEEASFSFNSPSGACAECKGFGKVIEIDPNLVIPDKELSIEQGAIKPFQGKVYSHCLDDLLNSCSDYGINPQVPWKKLSQRSKDLIWQGDPLYSENNQRWYGIKSFFNWLEKKTYKMHVRVFLSKYRGYFTCKECHGTRFKKEPQFWKWNKYSLPDLYSLPVSELLPLIETAPKKNDPKADLALEAIRSRLGYLRDVGLDYLSLDRTSRSLSGGETQRINLTACLGAGLTDTLFALDEPTIGLHHQDIGRLICVLRNLADAGNFVCVVEHDEQIIRAADQVIEIGPKAGTMGGEITFRGSVPQMLRSNRCITGRWLAGKLSPVSLDDFTKPRFTPKGSISIKGACKHNFQKLNTEIPLGRFIGIAGVSGSGKSTLVHDIIYQGLSQGSLNGSVSSDVKFSEIVLIDQGTVSKSPRSNPILYADAWSPIKEALSRTADAKRSGFSASDFSFNSGHGRCETCMGLGYQNVEMQFLPDLSIPCPICEGRRFKDELLEVRLDDLNVAEILDLNISEAVEKFGNLPKTAKQLNLLENLGLGYLKLGQPLGTLSGGEAQRLKLAKYMGPVEKRLHPALILMDEPTTGLHFQDVQRLVNCLRKVVTQGHSLLVIEHHSSVLLQSDWIIELGPGAGKEGGEIISQGTPKDFQNLDTPTARLLKHSRQSSGKVKHPSSSKYPRASKSINKPDLEIIGARENNLKAVELTLPSNQFIVITGPSGSGKSSLAFDVIFAEGQRRFLESMSSYARQFIQQIGKPRVDLIKGISPTVAIEQRVNKGSRKSTVGSITEIAQYLRLLYARLGEQYSPVTKEPLITSSYEGICRAISKQIKLSPNFRLLAPLVSNRKGHHKPLINWARTQGFTEVRCDGSFFTTDSFEGLDRYRSHDIEVTIDSWNKAPTKKSLGHAVKYSLQIGKGRCLLLLSNGDQAWFSTRKVDPSTGEGYPDLEPSFFSWNSPRGWCPSCRGHGKIYDWMKEELPASGEWWKLADGDTCPSCNGNRLNEIGRNVFLKSSGKGMLSLPQLLALAPREILGFLQKLKHNPMQKPILDAVLPEVFERLKFMDNVGLDYLSLNRETASLSGGESQRIRLAGQLGSNLSGVLYVLDEPSIGLHPADNRKLIHSLRELQEKGNSLLVVEHDLETIMSADCLVEIGPGAGDQGGKVVEVGTPAQLAKNACTKTGKYLSTGMSHPLRGDWRSLPRSKGRNSLDFIELLNVSFRNLCNLNLRIPMGRLVLCCGVSGAGKSSLVRGSLFAGVKESIRQGADYFKTEFYEVRNGNSFAKAIEVSQSPIGKTPRSTPVTYLGIWTRIRDLIASLPEAKARGFSSSDFSFNVAGGRCESCKGAGRIKLEMNFLPDSFLQCQDCKGHRYKDELLDLRWRGKNISEILDLTFEQAVEFFSFDEFLKLTFSLMTETGLGYLTLGQTSPTLSGGEAQRLKLAAELAKGIDLKSRGSKKNKRNLYVLEEPTIGLHSADCKMLIMLLHRLVDEGHTVVVIEHDIDLIAEADYLIELGPKGGTAGGKLLHQGTVQNLIKKRSSPTAKFLKKVLK